MFNQIQAKQLQKLTLLAFDHKHVDGSIQQSYLYVFSWSSTAHDTIINL